MRHVVAPLPNVSVKLRLANTDKLTLYRVGWRLTPNHLYGLNHKGLWAILANSKREFPTFVFSVSPLNMLLPASFQRLRNGTVANDGHPYIFTLTYGYAIDNVIAIRAFFAFLNHHVDIIPGFREEVNGKIQKKVRQDVAPLSV